MFLTIACSGQIKYPKSLMFEDGDDDVHVLNPIYEQI